MIQRGLERLFGTKILPGERRLVALLALDLFLLLTVYYILKVVREPLILMEGGLVSRNAARGAQALVLLAAVPAYGWVVNHVAPRKLVAGVFAAFLTTLLAFPVLAWAGVPVGFVFFVWLGLFSITVIAQIWSLANDLFTEEAGKRLFPMVAAGGTVGAVVGAQIVSVLNRWMGIMPLIVLAAALLAVCVWLTHVLRLRGDEHAPVHASARANQAGDPRGGFTLLLHDRYLLLIAAAIVLLNLVNSTGDQVLASIVQAEAASLPTKAARARYLTTFYANFQTWISLLTAALQVLAVARVVRHAGVRTALLTLPLLVLFGYAAVAVLPVLFLSRLLKIVENSADYSLQNTVQQMLFLPTPRAAKYKAKAAIDTFFVRFGDLGSWALVSLALAQSWSSRTLAIVNASIAGVWVIVALLLARGYERRSAEATRTLPARATATAADVVAQPGHGFVTAAAPPAGATRRA